MTIKVALRFRPFTHTPGLKILLPFSKVMFQIYPALIVAHGKKQEDIVLPIKGPVKNFTVTQDLEKGAIIVSGETKTGFMRYHLYPNENDLNSFYTYLEKNPENCLSLPYTLAEKPQNLNVPERLALGCHKQQDFEWMRRRLDLTEFVPVLHRLSLWLPKAKNDAMDSVSVLLQELQEAIVQKEKKTISECLINIYLAHFHTGLAPRIDDEDFQGILPSHRNSQDPLLVLSQLLPLIRNLFVQSSGNEIFLLPALPTPMHAGRLLNTPSSWGELDLEWSKASLQKMVFKAGQSQSIYFHFPKEIKRCRLQIGKETQTILNHAEISIVADQHYFFDRFEK